MGPCVGTSETVQAADSRLTRCVVGAALQIEVHSRPRLTASTESNKTAAATHVAPEWWRCCWTRTPPRSSSSPSFGFMNVMLLLLPFTKKFFSSKEIFHPFLKAKIIYYWHIFVVCKVVWLKLVLGQNLPVCFLWLYLAPTFVCMYIQLYILMQDILKLWL